MAAVFSPKVAPATNTEPKPQALPIYTVATLPDATLYTGRLVCVTNGNAGASCVAVSDGINWFPVGTAGTTACAAS